MDLSFLCVIGVAFLMVPIIIAGYRFRMKTVDYIVQKARNPALPPLKGIKYGTRLGRYLSLLIMLGVLALVLYGFVSTGQLIAAGFVIVFFILFVVMTIKIGSYWKDHFDL